jgi:RNA polymerase sigma-70 factor (ECF subfamily)
MERARTRLDPKRRETEFNRLYEAHYTAVRAYSWRRDAALADDIVAETFLVAWRRFEDVPVDGALPWLLGVARNVRLNMQRGERRRRERESGDAGQRPATVDPELHQAAALPTVGAEDGGRLLRLLEELPERDREVLLLVAWEALDRPAIAQILGCSRANVAVRLFRARRRLQALLESQDQPSEHAQPVVRAATTSSCARSLR